MPLSKEKKDKIIKKFKTHESDTGSSVVQIAILSKEIEEITKHLQEHKKDFSTRRGLLRKVGQRKRLLGYLERDNHKAFVKLVKDLKLNV
ncbi:MAG: 30S ribosomal protein S15 [Patescibacteria group bacterium]|jgi:small subunit ribosomal protein S15